MAFAVVITHLEMYFEDFIKCGLRFIYNVVNHIFLKGLHFLQDADV